MKKEISNKILLSFILVSFLISMLSISIIAQNIDAEQIKETSKTGIKAVFAPFIGALQGIVELLFGEQWINATRIFLFILLTLIIWSIMPLILGEDRTQLNFWISLVIGIISIMAIPPELLDTLLANYGAMGAAILTVIPFAIILVFSVRVRNALLARVVWVFYCIYYFALYLYKIMNASTASESMLYIFAIFGGIVMFFFIGKIRTLLWYGNMSAIKETGNQLIEETALLGKLDRKKLKRVYGSAGN